MVAQGSVVSGALGACGGESKKDPLLDGLRTEKKVELKQKAPAAKMTPEELAEARRKAGFRSADEIAAVAIGPTVIAPLRSPPLVGKNSLGQRR